MTKLAEFIEDYISQHELSRRALAEIMGVQHRTLNNYLNSDSSPTLYFLMRLSNATGYDLLTLVALVAPDSVHHASAESMLLAQQIDMLPEARRSIIVELIRAGIPKGVGESGDESKISVVKKSKRGGKK